MDKNICQCVKVEWEIGIELNDHSTPSTAKLWFFSECLECGKVIEIPYSPDRPKSLRERLLFLTIPEDVLRKGLDALERHRRAA